MEIEERYVIKFFTDEHISEVEIISRLRNYYEDDALSRTQMYSWIHEVRRGRADLSTIASPGRKFDESSMKVLPLLLLESSIPILILLSARKLANSLGITPSTVCRYLTEFLAMKCWHWR
jgi:hypothetical protein